MKKLAPFIIAISLCALSFDVKANDGLKLNSPPIKYHPFVIKPITDDEDNGMKGKFIVTAGAGFNFFGYALQVRYNAHHTINYVQGHQTSPMFFARVDYGLDKKISLGISGGYQTARIDYPTLEVNNYPGVGSTKYEHLYDDWTRVNLAVRGDYYIVSNKNINLYTGLKIGYNSYSVKTNFPDSIADMRIVIKANPVCVQAHFGFSYFIKEIVGVNAEFGLGYGGPYMLAAGLTIKI